MKQPVLDLSPSPGDTVKTTTCYMCACRCGIKVWIADGRIRYIQGNPEHPVNRGVLCAKGSAGIMQHYSPARLRKPLLRVGERGSGEFREIEWDEALQLATGWLASIRERNPDELAFFTGRDQSQALTGWWAQQFGTINYAAHGGFCSVNMAAGGLYTLGGSFWEFGEPDWEHTQYLMLWGVAEDHDSNPIKLGLGKLKARGAKIVAVNPVRTGYGAIADEWIGIRPGTDGLFAFALIHELLRSDRIDLDYLVRYANAHWLVVRNPGGADDGLFARDADGKPLCFDRHANAAVDANAVDVSPAVVGEYTLPDGRNAVPVFQLVAERYLDPQYSPDAVSERCGIPADTIRRIARELAAAAFDSKFSLPIAWTDTAGRDPRRNGRAPGVDACDARHQRAQQRLPHLSRPAPAAAAAGRDRYAGFVPLPAAVSRSRSRPANRPGRTRKANGALDAGPLGFVHGPEDLLVDANGQPRRIDHAFSWAYPLAAHGMLHTVIRNAWAGDPHRIDTLLMFMANMSWNSAMNTRETMHWLTDKDADGDYRIPRIIYSDAYASEMVAYADLVLPDTTYLERFDAISLLDRPISDADGVADAIRHPVFDPADAGRRRTPRDVRGFQSVLLDLGARLGLPGMVHADGAPAYRDYADYIVRHERAPGVGLLAGWRGAGRRRSMARARRIRTSCSATSTTTASGARNCRNTRAITRWPTAITSSSRSDSVSSPTPNRSCCSCIRRRCRNSASPRTGTARCSRRRNIASAWRRYFDPLPIWYEPFEGAQTQARDFPLSAITQRPMFMYHAWGSQNAWLRQIATRNFLYLHPDTGARFGIARRGLGRGGLAPRHASACRRSSPPTCSPTRSGAGTRSASASAHGRWPRTRRSRRRASCSTT